MTLQFPLGFVTRPRNCLVFLTFCLQISRYLCTTGNKLRKSTFRLPNVESVFAPVLEDSLGFLVTGAKGVDKEAKELQDQLLDIVSS